MDPEAALKGHDTILDFAISVIVKYAEENKDKQRSALSEMLIRGY